MQYLNDHWTQEIDVLGRDKFALAVRKLILSADTPFAMSISGRWGTGKTSMLRALMASLGGQPVASLSSLSESTFDISTQKLPESLKPYDEETRKAHSDLTECLPYLRTVWFNPWQYQNEGNPIVPLLHEIREQTLRHYTTATWLKKEKETLKHVFEAGLYSLGYLLDQAPFLNEVASKTQEKYNQIKTQYKQDTFSTPVDAQRFFLQFEKAINQIVGDNEKGRLIIFIDDLDRCHDDVVFKLLEAIKLYLSSRRCVFVFGLDAGHVETAITRASQFKPREAAQYVEKLFQVRLGLPAPNSDELTAFLEMHVKTLFDSSTETIQKDIVKYFFKYLPCNPRLIKNTLNGLKLHAELIKSIKPDFNWHRLILVHLFRTFYPDAYEVLLENRKEALPALSNLVKNMGFMPEQGDAMQLYLRRLMANPLYHIALQNLEKSQDLDDEQFREVRAGVWQASAFRTFQEAFIKEFATPETIGTDELKPYLL